MESLCQYTSDGDEDERSVHMPNAVVPSMKEEKALIHVFVVVQGFGLVKFVRRLMGKARLALVNREVKASFVEHSSFHVSISRTTTIPLSQVSEIGRALRSGFAAEKCGIIQIESRVIALPSASTHRLYIAAPVDLESSCNVVLPLIARTDSIYSRFGLPRFHEDPRPHMSFASTESIDAQNAFKDDAEPEGDPFVTEISAVVCEVGSKQLMFPLN